MGLRKRNAGVTLPFILAAASVTGCVDEYSEPNRVLQELEREWHSVAADCKIDIHGDMHLHLRPRGIQHIYNILFWSASQEEPLWALKVWCEPPVPKQLIDVTYGLTPVVPKSHLPGIKQVFPQAGRPRAIIPGERFFVRINYEYDNLNPPAAAASHQYFLFQLQADNSVVRLGTFSFVDEPLSLAGVNSKLYGHAED